MSRKLVSVQISSTLFLELANFLQEYGDERDPVEVVESALASWLAVARGEVSQGPVYGFQWKRLFLPDGTELKMHHRGQLAYTKVVGEVVMYQGRTTTPNKFAMEVAGSARNAWAVLWLRLPGQRYWKNARFVRNEQLRGPQVEAKPQFQPLNVAAAPAMMAQSLRRQPSAWQAGKTNRCPARRLSDSGDFSRISVRFSATFCGFVKAPESRPRSPTACLA